MLIAHPDSVGKVFIADLPANSFFLGGRIMKEAEIWQQEHHEAIWQTAVQTKIWRGRLKGGEEKVLQSNGNFTGGKKKGRKNLLSEELSMVCFKVKKLRCGRYDVYSSQAK